MSEIKLTRSHNGWDVMLGGLLVVLGLVVLANAVVATKVSVQFLGWILVVAGVAGLLAAVLARHSEVSNVSAVGGAISLVAGVICLRHVEAAALTLTLMAGGLFLLGGVVRLFAAFAATDHRGWLLLSGLVPTVLGLIVLFNLVDASYALLGVLLGVQIVADGVVLAIAGRVTVASTPQPSAMSPARGEGTA